MVTIPLALLILVFYAILDKDYLTNSSQGPQEHREVEYSIVGTSPDQTTTVPERPPCSEKLRIAVKILPFIIPLFLSFFAEYLSNSSVVTSIAFPESHVLPRDHFLFYSLSYRIGKFMGRSYLFIFACLPRDAVEFLKCDRTWVFAGKLQTGGARSGLLPWCLVNFWRNFGIFGAYFDELLLLWTCITADVLRNVSKNVHWRKDTWHFFLVTKCRRNNNLASAVYIWPLTYQPVSFSVFKAMNLRYFELQAPP